jgi:hypothetical protein
MGRRARARALSTVGLLAAPDWRGHPRLGGGRSLLGWRGPAAVCAVVSSSIATRGHVGEGWHNDSIIVIVRYQQQRRLQGQDVQRHQEEEGAAGEVMAADRGVLPPPVGVVGGNHGHVRRGGGEHER